MMQAASISSSHPARSGVQSSSNQNHRAGVLTKEGSRKRAAESNSYRRSASPGRYRSRRCGSGRSRRNECRVFAPAQPRPSSRSENPPPAAGDRNQAETTRKRARQKGSNDGRKGKRGLPRASRGGLTAGKMSCNPVYCKRIMGAVEKALLYRRSQGRVFRTS